MVKSVPALINPELLVCARNNSLLTIERAAKRVPVKTERLELWEQGELKPTIKQLRKLGHIYKRPIAVF
jgi:DNA-binding transcriptional regulator YiaG